MRATFACYETYDSIPTNMDANDTELVHKVLEGHEEAFEQLVHRYQRKVYTLILRMVRNRETALELAQDSFLKVYRKLSALKDMSRISPWIMQIAHNTTLDWLKRKRVDSVSADFDDQATQSKLSRFMACSYHQTPEDIVERLAPSDLDLLVNRLDIKYRTIITLRFVQGYQFHEIAQILELPLSTVKFRKHYAIKLLYGMWVEAHGTPG